MPQRYRTTDGRFVKVGEDEWWDTTGTDIVPDVVVDDHMRCNSVGTMVVELVEGEVTDDLDPRNLPGRPPLH